MTSALIWMNCHSERAKDVVEDGASGHVIEDANASIVETGTLGSLPYSAVGRLYFPAKSGHGTCSSCTAFLVQDDAVMTAAHCVMDLEGKWQGNLIFVRDQPSAEPGAYGVECAAVHPKWGSVSVDEAMRHDYALLKLSSQSDDGYLDFADRRDNSNFQVLGFKNNWSGNQLIQLDYPGSALEFHKDRLTVADNPLGEGGAGGPWLYPDTLQVFSLSSHSDGLGSPRVNGPLLGSETNAMVRQVISACH